MQNQEVVQQAVCKYSTDLVHGYKATYKPGENITIVLDSGNYLLDMTTLQLLFRPVYEGGFELVGGVQKLTQAVSAVKPEDLLTLNDLTINNISVKGHSEHEGRGIMMNFMKEMRPSNIVEEPQSMSNDVNYAEKGLAYSGVPVNYLDKTHLYQDTTGTVTSASLGPYQRNMARRAKHAQKYYKFEVTDAGDNAGAVVLTRNEADPGIKYESVKLVDLAPELLHLGQVSMIDKTIRIDLQLTDSNKVLTVFSSGVGAVAQKLEADATYKITDVCTYSRMLQIKPSMVSVVKQASMSPISQITYVQQSEAFSGSILNMKTALQHKNILGAVVFFQLANKSGASNGAVAIDYNAAAVVDNGRVHYYHDSYYIKTNSIYVEMGGKRFKQSDIPINDKQSASFINAQNSIGELFSNSSMTHPLCDFVQNKYAHVIPISPEAFDDDFVANSSHVNLHIEVNDSVRNASISSYKATVVYLCMQTLIPTESGMKLER